MLLLLLLLLLLSSSLDDFISFFFNNNKTKRKEKCFFPFSISSNWFEWHFGNIFRSIWLMNSWLAGWIHWKEKISMAKWYQIFLPSFFIFCNKHYYRLVNHITCTNFDFFYRVLARFNEWIKKQNNKIRHLVWFIC